MILEKEDFSGINHASMLTVLIQQLFMETKLELQQLDAIAVSAGPGSYTGLRIGVVTAKGLCFSLDKPLIAIDSLQALALGLGKKFPSDDLTYCPTIDARRDEVYFGLFGKNSEQILASNNITLSSILPFSIPDNHRLLVGGSGVLKCRQFWSDKKISFEDTMVSSARNMIFLSEKKLFATQFEDTVTFEPHYIKPVYITSPKGLK